jgi:hypothetical protein
VSVSAINAVAGQAISPYAPVAPVAKVKSVRRSSASKTAQQTEKSAPYSGPPKIKSPRAPGANASSAVLAALDDLPFGG